MTDFLGFGDKTFLIFGFANRRSVAAHVANILQECGAQLVLSVQNDQQKEVAQKMYPNAKVFCCDVSSDDSLADLANKISSIGPIAGIVHSIAFANYSEGIQPFHATLRRDFLEAIDISCYSFIRIANQFKTLMSPGGAMVTISISTTRMASESYGFMGPIKAALDSSIVFLAKSLSASYQIRVNGVGAGLLKTSASAGIPGYIEPYLFAEKATLRKCALKTEEVANTVAFLLSSRSSGINAQTVVVDAGMSVNYFDKEIVSKAVKEN